MILRNLSILNFKNIGEASLEFSPKLNCFLGSNGEGKTNLLDAIYYLSFCRSAFNPIDSQVIKHDADFLMLDAAYATDEDEPVAVYCGMKRGQKKQLKRDKRRISDSRSTSDSFRLCSFRLPTRRSSQAVARNGAD